MKLCCTFGKIRNCINFFLFVGFIFENTIDMKQVAIGKEKLGIIMRTNKD